MARGGDFGMASAIKGDVGDVGDVPKPGDVVPLALPNLAPVPFALPNRPLKPQPTPRRGQWDVTDPGVWGGIVW